MKKLLVIDKCDQCMWCSAIQSYNGALYLTCLKLEPENSVARGRIPSWCPLPDAPEEEEKK